MTERSRRDLLHVPLAVADPKPDTADATVNVLDQMSLIVR
jgi:hypothetical protein